METFPEENRREVMALLLMETLREGRASGLGKRVALGGWEVGWLRTDAKLGGHWTEGWPNAVE